MPIEKPQEHIEFDEKGHIAFRHILQNGRIIAQTSYLPAADGSYLHGFESVADEKGNLIFKRSFTFYWNGKPLLIHDIQEHTIEYFGKNEKIMHETHPNNPKKRDVVMFDEKGDVLIRTYQAEQKINPALTEEAYIRTILAKKLTTPERLHFFCDHFIQYLLDTRDRFRGNPDYWQKPEETVEEMTGDCEDVAILAQAILRLQGKNPYVVRIPTDAKRRDEPVHVHATCLWVEERADGRFDVCSLCSYGLDVNGNPFARKEKPERSKGYRKEEIVKGLNAIAQKYPSSLIDLPPGETYSFNPKRIRILFAPDRRRPGQETSKIVTTDVFFEK